MGKIESNAPMKVKSSKRNSKLSMSFDEIKGEFKVIINSHPEAVGYVTSSRPTVQNHAKKVAKGNGIFIFTNVANAQKLYDELDAQFLFKQYE